MNAKLALARRSIVATVVSAALAALIGIGILTAVTGLFQRDGTPFGQLVTAEHACANHSFESERKSCVRSYLAALRLQNVASR